MNARFVLITLSITIAVLSLALFIAVVGGTASRVSGEAVGIEHETGKRDVAEVHPLAYQGLSISQEEILTVTEPISIYLPLVSTAGYLDEAVERAALMALYNNTNGDGWINNTGWGTEVSFCEWYGVTCDANGHVTILELGANKLSGSLPAEIGNLANLQEIQMVANQLTSLPPEIGNLVTLQVLDLWWNQFTYLPPEIGNLVSLQELYLGYNQFTTLSPEIGNLASLQKLDLWNNQLTYLPEEFGNLASLQILFLDNNQLTSLPPEIGNLASLQVINLIGNKLTSLPPEIGNLVSLQELYLGYNQIDPLPPEIGNLVSLQWLDLGGNLLTSLPQEIGNLASLQELNLYSNSLSGPIPVFLSNLDKLVSLDLRENPDLTCWETEEARDWALSLSSYYGPSCFIP